MTTFLFWNLNRKPLEKEVATLCYEKNVDVLILAELLQGKPRKPQETIEQAEQRMLKALNIHPSVEYIAQFNTLAKKTYFFYRNSIRDFKQIEDYGRFSFREVYPSSGDSIRVVAVHLESKYPSNDSSRQYHAVRNIIPEINQIEKKQGHYRTLVIGDFNMHPFEAGMVNADAFHAIMDRRVLKRPKAFGTRTVSGKDYRMFYNPMWSKLGDFRQEPSGTYYWDQSENNQFFWNAFDQAIIRQDLLGHFSEDNFHVISEIAGTSLLKEELPGIDSIQFSDHLPILITLKTSS
ncbi:MAG: hypothetical protein F6J87_23650 [Spirulina sp. SIO3F2]|nr:hypothetical protein [Spirulina sp. SIO3F2]